MMRFLIALLAFVSTSYAGISTQCVSSDVCFSLNIPDTTVSSNNGDIYLQITGPTTYSWISVAQGGQMSGANYFVIYTSASGTNVTLSPRLGSGHNTPSFNSAAQVSLLEGSGVTNGVMVANIKCSNCNSWSGGSMTFSSSSTNWIWAYKSGSSIDSDSQSASIAQHDRGSYGGVAFDSTAQGGTDANPFLSSASTGSACSSSTAAGSAATSSSAGSAATAGSSTTTDSSAATRTRASSFTQTSDPNKRKRSAEAKSFLVARGLAARGLTAEAIVKRATSGCTTGTSGTSGAIVGTSSSSGTSSGVTTGSTGTSRSTLISIHGILAGFIFTLLFPFGGIMIRMMSFKGLLWAHGILQVVGYIGYLIAMGLGVYIALHPSFGELSKTHPILGFVLVALLFAQGPLGYIHHVAYKKYQRRTWTSYLHLWIGRIVIPLGMINCALGLKLSLQSTLKIIVYCVIAAIIYALYMIVVFIGERRRTRRLQGMGGEGDFQKATSQDINSRESLEMQNRRSRGRRSDIPHPPAGYYGSGRA